MSGAPRLETLPPTVRQRVVAIAADALPEVAKLPAPLRRVAAFAPARRARLGASAIAEALEDDDLRDRVALQAAARRAPGHDAGPAEEAAYAWLLRPAGWEDTLAGSVGEVRTSGAAPDAEADQLRGRLEKAEQALREQRASHREQVAELKAEVASLRRRLGEARGAERAARAESEGAARAVEEARTSARAELEALTASQDKELRRLRQQVAELEAELASGRRSAREEREDGTLRARMLLDTVLDAAAGLRRELALPPVSGTPGDRVEDAVVRAGQPSTTATSGSASPALLEQYLALPRARLVVDGYNVTKTAWPESPLEVQRTRLAALLGPLVSRTGAETTVVFDAGGTTVRPAPPPPRGIRVLFSPAGVIADDVIRDLVAAEPEGRVVVVVTSDRALAADVASAGARTVPADALVALLRRT